MKTRDKIWPALIVFVILFTHCDKEPEPEPEPEPPEVFEIVDTVFYNILRELGYDKNYDWVIDSLEALEIENLHINSCNISSLEGIQNFANLRVLSCGYNNLIELDVSHNKKLEEIYCNDNRLVRITLAGDSALVRLNCVRNELSTLYIAENLLLEHLECYENSLT